MLVLEEMSVNRRDCVGIWCEVEREGKELQEITMTTDLDCYVIMTSSAWILSSTNSKYSIWMFDLFSFVWQRSPATSKHLPRRSCVLSTCKCLLNEKRLFLSCAVYVSQFAIYVFVY